MPPIPPDLQFPKYFGALNVELSRLLDLRFIPGEREGGLVGIMLGRVLVHHNSGQPEFRDRELTKLSLLREDLRRIEAFCVRSLSGGHT
jgi:hypothetical protein